MNTSSAPVASAVYRERLQQAVRVMQDVSAHPDGKCFNINCYGVIHACGTLVCCIAGFCGLDPWFRERGFDTDLTNSTRSQLPRDFFGTEEPFYSSYYGGASDPARITVEHAIRALHRAIGTLPDDDKDARDLTPRDQPVTEAKIVRVSIGPMPQAISDPMPKVHAYFDDGTDAILFEYYPDELSFTESEFIGLTASEAKALRHRKDVEYLRS